MNFIEAVIKISKTDGFEFCDDEDALNGLKPISVFHHDEFIGKLRWPDGKGGRANIDDKLDELLIEHRSFFPDWANPAY